MSYSDFFNDFERDRKVAEPFNSAQVNFPDRRKISRLNTQVQINE